MIIIPLTAIMAFGTDLVHSNTGLLEESHNLIYYSEDFKGKLDFVYYIVSFYLFLNVTAFSVYIIVIR
jgi:ubiquinone biosynthesis protein COQ9